MKKKTILCALTLMLVFTINTSAQGVHFEEKPLAELLSMAQTEGKLVFVDCYTTWCAPCKKMAAEVFPQKEVGELMNPLFVSAKIDMEKGEGIRLNKEWDVNAYPTYVVLEPNGKVRFRLVGYFDTAKFTDTLTVLMKNAGPSAIALRYEAGERSSEVVSGYVAELAKNREYRKQESVVTDYCDSDPAQLLNDEKGFALFSRYITDPHSKAFLYVYAHRQEFINRYGDAVNDKLENTWRMFTKNFYVMGNDGKGGLGLDLQGMDEYARFMKSQGVAKADAYIMSYKLPAYFQIDDKEALMECLESAAGIPEISNAQFNYGCQLLEKKLTEKKELKRLEKIRQKREKMK